VVGRKQSRRELDLRVGFSIVAVTATVVDDETVQIVIEGCRLTTKDRRVSMMLADIDTAIEADVD
jgi:hypothetical protein